MYEAPIIYHIDIVHSDTLTDQRLRSKIDQNGVILYANPLND